MLAFENLSRLLCETTYSVDNDIPSLIPLKSLNINQNALQLNDGKRRVSVIELDSNLLRELLPRALRLLETTNNIVQRCSNPEVLLLETQLLTSLQVVIGVEDGADGLSTLLVGNGAFVVTAVELLEIELASGGLAGPESQVVGSGGIVTGDRNIVGNGLDNLAAFPDGDGLARLIGRLADATEELDLLNG